MPTAEQVVAILDGLKGPRHKMAWQLAAWLGNRSGELRGLRWESVVWEHNTILIRESIREGKSTLPKTKKGYRKVVLTDEQMQVLREYKEKNFPDAQPNAWVLPGKRGRPIDLGWLMSKHIKPLARKLGIPELHWHALRHLVGLEGFEPPTHGLGNRCSILLSYRPINELLSYGGILTAHSQPAMS